MITIRGLYKTFDKRQVLNGLDLSVREGETKVVIGRSGVGKSVLLKCFVGIVPPDAGSIRFNGQELTQLGEREYDRVRKGIGFVFQGGALFDSMSVGDNVRFFLDENTDLPAAQKNERAGHALSLVGLKGVADFMPSELSGGMRKRVSLARILCMQPKVILYDEPTTGLDPITADSINNLIIEMRNRIKVTSIVVTHDMTAAFRIADSIAMLYHGQVIADGTSDEIRNSRHPVVKQFINGEASGPITDDESLKFGHTK
jgi:phospholipid/cholesterol/gamma-HCH transport system ATP-binding protein